MAKKFVLEKAPFIRRTDNKMITSVTSYEIVLLPVGLR